MCMRRGINMTQKCFSHLPLVCYLPKNCHVIVLQMKKITTAYITLLGVKHFAAVKRICRTGRKYNNLRYAAV